MTEDNQRCEELLEEYQALVQRLEESEFALELDEDDESAIEAYDPEEYGDEFAEDDYERLIELERQIEEECDTVLPEDGTDLDLPEYADQAPSDPINRGLDGDDVEDAAEERADI